jgi:hypothetical protein
MAEMGMRSWRRGVRRSPPIREELQALLTHDGIK